MSALVPKSLSTNRPPSLLNHIVGTLTTSGHEYDSEGFGSHLARNEALPCLWNFVANHLQDSEQHGLYAAMGIALATLDHHRDLWNLTKMEVEAKTRPMR